MYIPKTSVSFGYSKTPHFIMALPDIYKRQMKSNKIGIKHLLLKATQLFLILINSVVLILLHPKKPFES